MLFGGFFVSASRQGNSADSGAKEGILCLIWSKLALFRDDLTGDSVRQVIILQRLQYSENTL